LVVVGPAYVIVAHVDYELVVLFLDRHVDPLCVRVFRDIGKRFGYNEVDGGFEMRWVAPCPLSGSVPGSMGFDESGCCDVTPVPCALTTLGRRHQAVEGEWTAVVQR
jgi:hypothetical protein